MIKPIFGALALVLLASCTTLKVDESAVFKPNHSGLIEEALPEGYQLREFKSARSDGSQRYGISVIHPNNKATVLYFGGNMFDVPSGAAGVIKRLTKANVNLYMFDRRGYGYSSGKPTTTLALADALENFDVVRAEVQGKLIVHGISLGSFEAGHVAKNRDLDGLVLEGSTTNVDEWARTLVPWYAKPFISVEVSDALRVVDNIAVVQHHKAPLLVMVGDQDNVTPVALSQKLFDQSQSSVKQLFIAKGMGHTTATQHKDFASLYSDYVHNKVTAL